MAKMVFCFLLVHRKWAFGKIQRFSTEKRNLFATNWESAVSDFLQLQGLVFHKSFLLGKSTEANSLKGQERAPGKELLVSLH